MFSWLQHHRVPNQLALNNGGVSHIIDTCAVAAYQVSGGRLQGVCGFGVDPLATSRELTQQRLAAMELNNSFTLRAI